MKKLTLVAFIGLGLSVFAGEPKNTKASKSLKVDAKASTLKWHAKKVTGEHFGTINVSGGNVTVDKGMITGGAIEVDMTSINVTDLQGEYKGKLEGHLKSDDFFGVEKFPTATLVFKTIGEKGNGVYAVTADLTIKGITHPIKFELTVDGNMASTTLKVDRTKYNITYKSGNFFSDLGDNIIYDEFELAVKLAF